MATATAPMRVQGSSWLRPKYLLFAFFGFMFVYVLGHNETFLINRADPVWHHYQPFKWYLLAHGLAGACALILGPMQFSERLRRKYKAFREQHDYKPWKFYPRRDRWTALPEHVRRPG